MPVRSLRRMRQCLTSPSHSDHPAILGGRLYRIPQNFGCRTLASVASDTQAIVTESDFLILGLARLYASHG